MRKVCGFCGHSDTPQSIRNELKSKIETLIREKHVRVFYVGNHGSFDRMVLSVLQELHISFPDIQYYVVLAYIPHAKVSDLNNPPTIFPEGLETVPRRAAIPRRNKWLVEQSDYMIAYVTRSFGGAAQTLAYAYQRKLEIVNLATEQRMGAETARP